jgi:hypothetical protein
MAVLASEQVINANNLWNVVVGFLTASPSDCQKARSGGSTPVDSIQVVGAQMGKTARFVSFFVEAAVGEQRK